VSLLEGTSVPCERKYTGVLVMLVRGRTCVFEWANPWTDFERLMIFLIDKSKGMIFDGSVKYCMYRARATPRSSIGSQGRDRGINGK